MAKNRVSPTSARGSRSAQRLRCASAFDSTSEMEVDGSCRSSQPPTGGAYRLFDLKRPACQRTMGRLDDVPVWRELRQRPQIGSTEERVSMPNRVLQKRERTFSSEREEPQ